MDAFGGGWSTAYAAEPCLQSRPAPAGDDDLLNAFLFGSFDGGLPSDQSGGVDLPSSYPIPNPTATHCHHDGAYLPDGVAAAAAAAFMGMDTADVLPGATGAALDDGLVVVAEEPAQTNASNTGFSGCSSTTGGNGGGNVSSGESNTCGGGFGHDMEVASPCAAPPPALAPPPSKRKVDESYAALAVSATTATEPAAARRHRRQAPAVEPPVASGYEPDAEAIAQQVKEMVYRAAAMRPVHQLVCAAAAADASSPAQGKRRRRKVRISSDPQTVAERLRRERVSARLRVLQRLVPGGSRMDTASMLDEAASYLRFLKSQLKALESAGNHPSNRSRHSVACCRVTRAALASAVPVLALCLPLVETPPLVAT